MSSRMSRRQFIAAAAAVGGAGLAACGAAAGTGTPDAKSMAPVRLRYAASFQPSEGTTWAASASKLIEMWNAKGTPVTVEPINLTGNRTEKVLAMVAAGDAPDLSHALPRDRDK